MYGDMILDETKYGFISNYNHSVFFRKADNVQDKTLEFSPTILVGESPLTAFLFVLFRAHADRAVKKQLPRAAVPIAPVGVYPLILPPMISVSSSGRERRHPRDTITVHAGKHWRAGRRRFLEVDLSSFSVDVCLVEDLHTSPGCSLVEFCLSGRVVGLGTYGNVVEGELGGIATH